MGPHMAPVLSRIGFSQHLLGLDLWVGHLMCISLLSQEYDQVGATITPILQTGKLRLREVALPRT